MFLRTTGIELEQVEKEFEDTKGIPTISEELSKMVGNEFSGASNETQMSENE